MGQRLTQGHVNTGIARHDQAIAADLFMEAIRRLCPRILEALASGVHHPATSIRYTPWRGRPDGRLFVGKLAPSPELAAWATSYHLKSDAIYDWAARAVECWQRRPEMRARLQWEAPPRPKQTPGIWKGHTSEREEDLLSPVGAMPEIEHQEDFERRAAKHWSARVKELKRQGASVLGPKRNDKHFAWLVRYQCFNESLREIGEAKDVNQHEKTVHNAVMTTAKLVGLARRPGGKGGRPRMSSEPKPSQ